MTIRYQIHPKDPQERIVKQVASLLTQGKVLAVPTDSSYALVCRLDDKVGSDAMRKIRQIDQKHHLTLLCQDLKELSQFAKVDNWQFRLLKNTVPGPYTFILPATRHVPRRLSHPNKQTIGLRVPDHKVLQALLAEHGSPLLATTLILPGEEVALNNVDIIEEQLGNQLAAILDAGACPLEPTTVVDLGSTENAVTILRYGRGDPAKLGL